jgi:hypothetical protein
LPRWQCFLPCSPSFKFFFSSDSFNLGKALVDFQPSELPGESAA